MKLSIMSWSQQIWIRSWCQHCRAEIQKKILTPVTFWRWWWWWWWLCSVNRSVCSFSLTSMCGKRKAKRTVVDINLQQVHDIVYRGWGGGGCRWWWMVPYERRYICGKPLTVMMRKSLFMFFLYFMIDWSTQIKGSLRAHSQCEWRFSFTFLDVDNWKLQSPVGVR